MACRICHRSSCTESFHSIAEQEAAERLELGVDHAEVGSVDLAVLVNPARASLEPPRKRACGFCDGTHDRNCPKALGLTFDDQPIAERVVSNVEVDALSTKAKREVDRVRVWNRGELAGDLYVAGGDGDALRERLSGGMCSGRANASSALEAAAAELARLGAHDSAARARAAAVEVRKEIWRARTER